MSIQQQFDDPKIVLTLKIINAQEEISSLLNNGLASKAAKEMATLLLRLDIPKEEKELPKLRILLTPENYHLFSKTQVFKFYSKISEFLNRTYFADFHRARPRFKNDGAKL